MHTRYYEDLGVTADMSSKLITSAYIQQTRCDPDRAPYYFKCLRAIGHWRESYDGGEIAKFVQQRYAEGAFADDDIPDAYRFFQLDMGDKSLTDENIIGSFYARLDDSPDEAEPRRQLLRIGNYRNSASIKAVAEERRDFEFSLTTRYIYTDFCQMYRLCIKRWCIWVLTSKLRMTLSSPCIRRRYGFSTS